MPFDHRKKIHAYLQKKIPAYYQPTNTLRLLEGDWNNAVFMTDGSAQDDTMYSTIPPTTMDKDGPIVQTCAHITR